VRRKRAKEGVERVCLCFFLGLCCSATAPRTLPCRPAARPPLSPLTADAGVTTAPAARAMLSPRAPAPPPGLAGVAADLDAIAQSRPEGLAGGLLTGWLPGGGGDAAARDRAAAAAAAVRALPQEDADGWAMAHGAAMQVGK